MTYIGADHAGFKLKEEIEKYLIKKKVEFIDVGNGKYEKEDDYPDFASKLCKSMGKNNVGILICGSGHGMNIAANKFAGIRATICWNEKSAKYARKHTNINVMCLPARLIKKRTAIKITKIFLNTKFSNKKRHIRRIKKIK